MIVAIDDADCVNFFHYRMLAQRCQMVVLSVGVAGAEVIHVV